MEKMRILPLYKLFKTFFTQDLIHFRHEPHFFIFLYLALTYIT